MELPYSAGTWRRLKIALETRGGHGLPRLPPDEFERFVGLIASVRDGNGAKAVGDDRLQQAAGQAELAAWTRRGLSDIDQRDEALRLARSVDVRGFL